MPSKSSPPVTTRRQFLTRSAAALAGAALSPSLLTAKVSPSRAARSAAGPRARPIPTAVGEILPEQMGITSLHEHIALRRGAEHHEESLAYAIRGLQRAKALGLRTIVDVGPPDDVAGIQELSLIHI